MSLRWLRGLLPSFWENEWMRAKVEQQSEYALGCELRKRTMLSLQPYSSWILGLVWDGHVGGWNALQAALVCTISRDADWEIIVRLTSQRWNDARVEKYRVNMWPLTEAYGWHNLAVICQISVKATVAWGVEMGVDLKLCQIKISDQQWLPSCVTEKPPWWTRTSEIDQELKIITGPVEWPAAHHYLGLTTTLTTRSDHYWTAATRDSAAVLNYWHYHSTARATPTSKNKAERYDQKTEYPCAYKCHQHQRSEKILLQAPDRPLYGITTFNHHGMISTEDLVCDGTTVYGKYWVKVKTK